MIRHICVSVDIDRFTDAKLRREFLPLFQVHGVMTVDAIREACADHRARGFVVFPSCDNHKPDGTCAGHEEGGT